MGAQPGLEEHAVVPQLAEECDLGSLTLTPAEGYLLSRVDGRLSWGLLREVGGMAPEEVDACLRRFLEQGVLVPDAKAEPPPSSASEVPQASPSSTSETSEARPSPALDADREALLDASLDMPLDAQRAVLEFECGLDRPYHEILGVAFDADTRVLRRAYFRLSKEFHPDRWFRKDLGAFAERVECVFRKIAEAYELLSDPSARKEVEASLRAAPAPEPGPESAPRPGRPVPRLRGRATPHAFSLVARIQRERRRKARRYFDLGQAALAQEDWVDAAKHLRLAIACDPAEASYKEPFAEANRRANEILAARYLKEADALYQLGEYPEAYKRYVDALYCRPFEAEANHRAALLAWRVEGDLRSAKDYAVSACEVEPENPRFRRTLGQIYGAAGLYKNAQRELEHALQLDGGDEEARRELKTMKRMARRAPLGDA